LIRPARPDEIDAVRELFREYGAFVGSPICFESFEREIASLPGEYICLLVAEESGQLAGCAALRNIGEGIAEMKRLYVRPAFQGRGLGRLLTGRIIYEARDSGHKRIRLDTLRIMGSALALYRGLGFREIPPYGGNPPEAICFELPL
jgi:GNAT superfamily N-acetyltransferase